MMVFSISRLEGDWMAQGKSTQGGTAMARPASRRDE